MEKLDNLQNVSGGDDLDDLLAQVNESLYEKQQTVYAPNGKVMDIYKVRGDKVSGSIFKLKPDGAFIEITDEDVIKFCTQNQL